MTRSRFAAAALSLFVLAACDDSPSASGRDEVVDSRGVALVEDSRASAQRADPNAPTVIRFRSVEDAASPPDPAVCAAAPFGANVLLGASLWSEAGAASDGRVVNNSVRRIGTATACVRITNPAFPEGLRQDFYVRFDLAEGSYTALGTCTVTSNDVPQAGLVLAGCALKVTDAPFWIAGGSVSSISVFNPRRLPGFSTGSEWTLQLYPKPRG